MKREKAKSFRNSIRDALFFYGLAAVVGVIAVLAITIGAALYSSVLRQSKREHQEICLILEQTVGNAKTALGNLAKDPEFAAGIREKSLSPAMYERLYSVVNAGEMRGNFYLVDDAFRYFSGSNTIRPDYFKKQFSYSQFTRSALENGKGVCAGWEKSGNGGLPSYVLAVSVGEEEKPEGYLLVEFSQRCFADVVDGLTADVIVANSIGRVYWDTGTPLTDERGRLLREVRAGKGILAVNGRCFYTCVTGLDSTLIVYTVKDITELIRVFSVVGIIIVLAFAGMLVLDRYVSAVVAGNKTEIIDQINNVMQQGLKDDLHTPMVIDREDEFGQIANVYNNLGGEINRLMENNREITRLQMLAEVRRLESQFNPHFLFNALETIRVLICMEPENAQKAITKLAELLRYSIDDSFGQVRLEEDMHYTECYLFIQKMRFQKKLEYRIEQEMETQAALVPRLIIQPLVENAIQYGKNEEGFCNIEIHIGHENDRLWIQVMDQGSSMSDEKIAKIRELLEQEQNTSVHLGLYQLHRRMRLTYGADYGLKFWRREEGGMCFRLELPYEI